MNFRIAVLSVLVPAVIAVPKFPHQPRGVASIPTGGSSGTGAPVAPYGQLNATVRGPTGTGSIAISVVTLVPIPGATDEGAEEALPMIVNTAPLPQSSRVPGQPFPVTNEGEKNPDAAVQKEAACGPATVTVTEANTVTVTVGAVSATSSSISPSPADSDNAGLSGPPGGETTAATNLLPTAEPPASRSKHGHNHLKFHHKSAGSSKSSKAAAVEPKPAASSAGAPPNTVPAVPDPPEPLSNEKPPSPPDVTPQINRAQPVPEETESAKPAVLPVSTPPVSPPLVESPAPEPESKPESKALAPSSPGTKRGLVYNTAALTESFASSPVISWCYNWDSQPGGTVPSQFNFVPMMWGPLPVHTGRWKSNADKAIAAGATHLLAFNEPDLPQQANLTPEQAVEAWREYLEPYAGKAKLGSPAVCNGGGEMGLNWLARFLAACSGCTIDFIAIHWYGLASDDGVGHFKEHVGKAVQAAQGRPVWITEFQPNGSPEEQARWLKQVLPWLDDEAQSGVERYSYFQVDNILVNGGSLTELGNQYAS